MAGYMLNIAKGRAVQFFINVDGNSPTNSVINIIPLSVSDTEGNRQDDDTVTVFLAATPNEQTSGSWARKVLSDTDIATPAPNDTSNYYACTVPAVTWTAPTASNNVVALLFAYGPDSTADTDSTRIPICVVDFAVTADGNDVVLNAGDIVRCS